MAMITGIEDYFTRGSGRCARFATPDCSTRFWIGGLNALRVICRDTRLQEMVKSAHPCYLQAGRSIALIGAFRGDFRLTLFNAALLQGPREDPDGQGAQEYWRGMSFVGNIRPQARRQTQGAPRTDQGIVHRTVP